MYSREHLAISIVVGGILVPVVETPLGPAGTVAFAGLVGTLIDLDHFVIVRVRRGSWAPLRRASRRPRRVFFAQDELFEPAEVGAWPRIVSHLAIGSLLVVGFLARAPSLAVVTAAVLGTHVVSDVLWDAWRARRGSTPETGPDESTPTTRE